MVHFLPDFFGTLSPEGISDILDPVHCLDMSEFHIRLCLEGYLEIVGILRNFTLKGYFFFKFVK